MITISFNENEQRLEAYCTRQEEHNQGVEISFSSIRLVNTENRQCNLTTTIHPSHVGMHYTMSFRAIGDLARGLYRYSYDKGEGAGRAEGTVFIGEKVSRPITSYGFCCGNRKKVTIASENILLQSGDMVSVLRGSSGNIEIEIPICVNPGKKITFSVPRTGCIIKPESEFEKMLRGR